MPVLDCQDHNTPDFKIVTGIDLDGFEVLVGKSTINASRLLPLGYWLIGLSDRPKTLQQINEKNYAIPYQTDGRRVVKVGVSMNAEKRTVEEWEIESLMQAQG